MQMKKFNTHQILVSVLSVVSLLVTVCAFGIDSNPAYWVLLPAVLLVDAMVYLLLHYFRVTYPELKVTHRSLVLTFASCVILEVLAVLVFFVNVFITEVSVMLLFAVFLGFILGILAKYLIK